VIHIFYLLCVLSGYDSWYSAYSEGDWQSAREEAEFMIEDDSTSSIALAAMSLSVFSDESADDSATELALLSLEADSSQSLAWAALGMSLLKADPLPAVEALTKAVEFDSLSAIAWEGLGLIMIDSGEYGLAVSNMQHSVMSDSSYIPGWLGHSTVLEESGDPNGALTVMEIALSRAPSNMLLLFQKAWIFEELMLPDSALATYGTILEQDPASFNALKYSGLLYEDMGQLGRAVKMYRQLIAADSTYSWAYGEIAYCYELLNLIDFAEEWYLKGMEIDPSYAWAAYRLGVISRDKDLSEGLLWFELATQLDPLMSDAWVEMGLVYEDQGDFVSAVQCLETALEISPDDDWTWGELGYLLQELGRNDEAAEAYEQGVHVNPGYLWGWQQRGLLYEILDDYEGAISWYRMAIEQYGSSTWLLGELGSLLEATGDRDSAMVCYAAALEEDSCYTYGLHRLARNRRESGYFDEALNLLDRYLECSGDTLTARYERVITLESAGLNSRADSLELVMLERDPDAWLDAAWTCYYMDDEEMSRDLGLRHENTGMSEVSQWIAMAELYEALEKDVDSYRCYDKAVGLDSLDVNTWVAWGSMLSSADRFSEAAEKLERAVEIDSTSIDAWSVLGEALLFDDRYVLAEEALQKIMDLDPGSVYAICYFGLIRERSGRPLEALDYYLEALQLYPGYSYAEDRIRAISDPVYDSDWWSRDAGKFNASLWFDISVTSGNTDERNVSAGASLSLKYDSRGSSITLDGGGKLEKIWERETKNTAYASLNVEHFLSDALYIEASSTWDRQPITVRPWQISSYIACGYKKWISDWLWVAPEMGVGLVSSRWSLDPDRTDNPTAYGSIGIWFEKTGSILPEIWIAGSVYFPPGAPDDLIAYGDVEITFNVWKPLSMSIGYSVDYTRKPSVSTWEKYDTEIYSRIYLNIL
jgi:tetratricopeptide (TPR) repeat protein